MIKKNSPHPARNSKLNGSILSQPLDRPSAVAQQRLTQTCAPIPYNGWTIGLFRMALEIMLLNLKSAIRPATPHYLQCYQLICAKAQLLIVISQHTLGVSVSCCVNHCGLWALLSAFSPLQDLLANTNIPNLPHWKDTSDSRPPLWQLSAFWKASRGGPTKIVARIAPFQHLADFPLHSVGNSMMTMLPFSELRNKNGHLHVNAVQGFCSTINSMRFTNTFRQQDAPLCRQTFGDT